MSKVIETFFITEEEELMGENMRQKLKDLVGHKLTYPQIDSILSLFQSEMTRIVKKSRPMVYLEGGIKDALDQYESTLIQKLEEVGK